MAGTPPPPEIEIVVGLVTIIDDHHRRVTVIVRGTGAETVTMIDDEAEAEAGRVRGRPADVEARRLEGAARTISPFLSGHPMTFQMSRF